MSPSICNSACRYPFTGCLTFQITKECLEQQRTSRSLRNTPQEGAVDDTSDDMHSLSSCCRSSAAVQPVAHDPYATPTRLEGQAACRCRRRLIVDQMTIMYVRGLWRTCRSGNMTTACLSAMPVHQACYRVCAGERLKSRTPPYALCGEWGRVHCR